jgi:ribosome production factor 2
LQVKTKKNVEIDTVGDKLGRIHVGVQDLRKLQTRKMRGLKRGREDEDDKSAKVKRKKEDAAEWVDED